MDRSAVEAFYGRELHRLDPAFGHAALAGDALEQGWVKAVRLGQRRFSVYDTLTGLYVSLALCNHGGANLCYGYLDGHVIECPLHQGAFDVRDRRPVSAPATRRMKVFDVWVVVEEERPMS
ncbi:MAG: Rieske 2Fe-2S domain-containing protein [Albidovulum sp.]|uniref:Rieske 2Fe-2S domain-containing protein n=1 Tax=Albidovulum sp. TaxID=1872424 RepID=UPI003C854C2D